MPEADGDTTDTREQRTAARKNQRRRRADAEVEARRHVSSEERAFRWVEHLAISETMISDVDLKKMINEITPSHYQDITEERSLSKICGYPVCVNPIPPRKSSSRQKYRISGQLNRIYNAEELHRFCSAQCFKNSKVLESQILSTPLWLRKNEDADDFVASDEESDEQQMKDIVSSVESLQVKERIITSGASEPSSRAESEKALERKQFDRIDNAMASKCAADSQPLVREAPQPLVREAPQPLGRESPPLLVIESPQPLIIESPEPLVREAPQPLVRESPQPIARESPMPDIVEKESECHTAAAAEHMSVLDRVVFTIRDWMTDETVRLICRGDSGRTDTNTTVESIQPSDEPSSSLVLPSVQSCDQTVIRRRIVMEKLALRLARVCPIINVVAAEAMREVSAIVTTFRFTSVNISLKPKEWSLLCLIVLRLAVNHKPEIVSAFESGQDEVELYVRNLDDSSSVSFKGVVDEILEYCQSYTDDVLLDDMDDVD